MIGFLKGTILEKNFPELLLDVMGVGYEISLPMTSFSNLGQVGEIVGIYTHLSIREDAHLLFGFTSKEDRLLFRSLIKTNGVGPKLALAILSAMSTDDFAYAIEHNEISKLVKIPGVGKKTAERLVVELQGKFKDFEKGSLFVENVIVSQEQSSTDEAVLALVSLGYKQNEASKMIKKVYNDNLSVEELIKEALKRSF